ncbi:hypothetical protein KM043_013425 [Ampulex compressa]|nr:hypothetical protein KM043_013425 [Ampulex compressa]
MINLIMSSSRGKIVTLFARKGREDRNRRILLNSPFPHTSLSECEGDPGVRNKRICMASRGSNGVPRARGDNAVGNTSLQRVSLGNIVDTAGDRVCHDLSRATEQSKTAPKRGG